MKKEFLFMGGEFDGSWITVDTNAYDVPKPRWTLTVPPKQSASARVAKSFQNVVYRREELHCESLIWYFYTPVAMTAIEIVDRLIKGYGKKGKEEGGKK